MKGNKCKRINLRLTEDEFELLSKRINSSVNNRLSDYLRRVIFERPITTLSRDKSLDDFMQELIRLRTELNSIGGNFNQLVKRINSSDKLPALTYWVPLAVEHQKEVLAKIAAIQQRINQFSDRWLRG